jgi:hypothetical protein
MHGFGKSVNEMPSEAMYFITSCNILKEERHRTPPASRARIPTNRGSMIEVNRHNACYRKNSAQDTLIADSLRRLEAFERYTDTIKNCFAFQLDSKATGDDEPKCGAA